MKKRGVFNLNKKSQVAIFLILALVIVLAGVIYFFYQREGTEKNIPVVEPEAAPVNSFVQDCIKSVGENSLDILGLGGGYIDVPEKTYNDPRAVLSTAPGAAFRIPYWWHNGILSIPTEEFMQKQLNDYIRVELKNCIDNFESFSSKYEIKPLKEPVVDSKFNENDVSVNVKYPMQVATKDGSFKTELESFSYTIPVRFKKVYELAKLIMERENNDYFIERKTIDLYSMDKEIPTTDIEATCNAKIWQLSNIKERLKRLLTVNLPYIRIKGTDYDPNLYVPNPKGKSVYSQTYFQNHYVWELDKDSSKFKNMKVSFSYEDWPLTVYARPSENGILRSNANRGSDMLSFFCLHIWHFTYDIEYPVLATVIDQKTSKNRYYQFSFPFKVSIDHNQPNRVSKGTSLFETEPDLSSDEFCNEVRNEITIFTSNNATGEDLRHVNLTFICGRFYCDIGESDWLSFGAAAGLTRRLPYCVNGIVKGSREGFQDSKTFVQTDVDGRSYVLLMNPVKQFSNYKVVKHLLSSPGIAEELAPNEKASILLKSKNTGFESLAVYPQDASLPLKLQDEKDDTYEVTIYLTDDKDIIGGYMGNWKVKKEDLTGNEIVFHAVVQGQASDDEKFLFLSGLSSYSEKVPVPEIK